MDSKRRMLAGPVVGISLIIVGALLMFGQLFHIGSMWPLFILLPGAMLLFFAVTGDRNAAPLAIPGMLVAGTGTILLYQSVTGNWQSWAYVWTLYPALLGAGMWLMGRLDGSVAAVRTGRNFVIGGLTGFVLLGALFEATVFSRMVGGLGWPVVLIALGIGLLLAGTRRGALGRRW